MLCFPKIYNLILLNYIACNFYLDENEKYCLDGFVLIKAGWWIVSWARWAKAKDTKALGASTVDDLN